MFIRGSYKLLLFSAFLASLMAQKGADCQQPLPTTKTLEELVSQWVDLRQQISLEQQSWKEQKGYLEREHELLRKEKQLLEREIAEKGKLQSLQEAQRAELIQKKTTFQKALDSSLPPLAAAEASLKQWRSWIPPSLSSPSEKLFDKLENTSKQSVSQRLQLVLSLYGEIERLQYAVHVVKEILQTDFGQEQEFDVIYLGLAQGYCVSSDGKLAGIGRPTKNGSGWSWHPEIAKEVRRGINFYKHEKIADFVILPLRVAK